MRWINVLDISISIIYSDLLQLFFSFCERKSIASRSYRSQKHDEMHFLIDELFYFMDYLTRMMMFSVSVLS